MSTARDERLRELDEPGLPAEPTPTAGRRRTRVIALVVVLVECAWLAAVTYAVWWLFTRI